MNNSEKHLSQAQLSESSNGNVLTKITQNVAFRFSFLCSTIYSTEKITLDKKKKKIWVFYWKIQHSEI